MWLVAGLTHPLILLLSIYSASCFNERHHPYQAISHHFASPVCICILSLSFFLSLNVSLPLGISFLSAFYSKSDRKALDTQPDLRDSGYIWFA